MSIIMIQNQLQCVPSYCCLISSQSHSILCPVSLSPSLSVHPSLSLSLLLTPAAVFPPPTSGTMQDCLLRYSFQPNLSSLQQLHAPYIPGSRASLLLLGSARRWSVCVCVCVCVCVICGLEE